MRVRRGALTHLHRFWVIASLLLRHGLGWAVGPSGVGRLVPFHHGWLGHPDRDEPYERQEHIRMLLEDLGPTFMKIGQILSSRADLLPPAYRAELSHLQDDAPPVSSSEILEVIASEFGRPVLSVFAEFDDEPLASASIGQAHIARLHDGTPVVVKVRRPGVVDRIELDLRLIASVVGVAARLSPTARLVDVTGIFEEFSSTLRKELDYCEEAANADRFASNFAGHPHVVIPCIHHGATTGRVLTLDLVVGTKIDDVDALRSGGIDPAAIASLVVDMALVMIFDHGFFHADLHPGNLFVQPDGRVGLIDFGMVGHVDDATRANMIRLLIAVATGDSTTTADAVIAIGISAGTVDRARLETDLDQLARSYVDQPVGEIEMAALLHDNLAVLRQHRLRLPSDLALLVKTLGMLEGLAGTLDPKFRLVDALGTFVAQRPELLA